ncbi:MAG: hypothetical protein K8V42_06185 [Enterococcus aquimarinus]|uniref:Uncharacterized protein n=1 Tax=Enterococcus aquimarinus TaxID=328396 RepID=A0A9E3ZVL2_9ENTE|nr:hypothetical protein [Enterococcus aquimarinus]
MLTEKTYLNEIMDHYFDTMDLNENEWFEDDKGFYTYDKEEIKWFKRLNKALDNISEEELRTVEFNDYDAIIEYYEGSL